MATPHILDLSQPITPASPAPCDPPVEFRTVASHSPDSPYQMMWFGMTDHTGTHIDAPLHFFRRYVTVTVVINMDCPVRVMICFNDCHRNHPFLKPMLLQACTRPVRPQPFLSQSEPRF